MAVANSEDSHCQFSDQRSVDLGNTQHEDEGGHFEHLLLQ
jgi:hypothetical protein